MANYTVSYQHSGDVTNAEYDVTQSMDYEDKCKANNNLFTIAFIPFKFVVMVLNFLLFAAAARDRVKLRRQNYTFHCIMSTLLSNTVYLAMSIWLTVDNYPQVAMEPQEGIMSKEKYIWIFSEAATACMVIGICANVTSLIYVTLDSVLYVGRSGTEWGSANHKKDNAMLFKVRVTQLLVAASWVLPVLLTTITFGWNCAKQCRCPSNNFHGEHCPKGEGCSSMWAPIKTNFLLIVLGIWLLQVIGLIAFLIIGIQRHNRSMEHPTREMKDSKVDEGPCDVNGDVIVGTPRKCQTTFDFSPRRRSTFRRKFNWRLKFATGLTILLVACTAPATISTLIDSFTEDPPYTTLVLISAAFMFLYCVMCPILMWKFLPSLRSSTFKMLLAIRNCSCITARDHKKSAKITEINV